MILLSTTTRAPLSWAMSATACVQNRVKDKTPRVSFGSVLRSLYRSGDIMVLSTTTRAPLSWAIRDCLRFKPG